MSSVQANNTTASDLNAALEGLLRKYAVRTVGRWRLSDGPDWVDQTDGELAMLPGWSILDTDESPSTVPLLPWRHERRFVELKGLVDGRTIEPVLMCRFACMTDGRVMPLSGILYREFDLIEWLVGSPIGHLYASIQEQRAANVVVCLESRVVCSVEATAMLPADSPMQERHELIARRGVASDRVVDTQVAQSSVYAFTDGGAAEYTDTDAELFGLAPEQVALVRAACEMLSDSRQQEQLRRRHRRLAALVRLAFESDRKRQRLAVEGDLS